MVFVRISNPHPSFQFGMQRASNFGKPGFIPFNPKVPIGYPNPNAVGKSISKLERSKK